MRLIRSVATLAIVLAAVLASRQPAAADSRSVVSGTVRDDAGQAVAGARVYVFSPGQPLVSTTTDKTGFFVIFSQNYGLAEVFTERTGDAYCRSGPKPVSAESRVRNPAYNLDAYARTHVMLVCTTDVAGTNAEAVDVLAGR